MTKLAGLPMYDFAELREATDAFWHAIHIGLEEHGISNSPAHLTRAQDLPLFWSDPALLLGQTCGYPLMMGLCGKARYVATPMYQTRFSKGPEHKSLIITHRDSNIRTLADAKGKICAINMADSNTGMNLLRLEISKLVPRGSFFSDVFETHAHRKSMAAVANGKADLASIDCVTFALVEQIDPALSSELKIIAETEVTPALPIITSSETDEETISALRDVLFEVTSDPLHRNFLDPLMISGMQILPTSAYERVCEIESEAIERGYPDLV